MLTPSTQLSMREMRKRGYLVGKTEYWNSFTHHRVDLWGILDFLCLRSGEIVGLQTTSYTNIAGHRQKILQSITVIPILQSGMRLLLQGWKKGKTGRWELKEEEYVLDEQGKNVLIKESIC